METDAAEPRKPGRSLEPLKYGTWSRRTSETKRNVSQRYGESAVLSCSYLYSYFGTARLNCTARALASAAVRPVTSNRPPNTPRIRA
jgi:hypothetical protein